MKRSLNELIGYSIKAKNGEKGKVKNFLFDDRSWSVRYLEAELGNIFFGRRVLIPRIFLGEPDWDNKHFQIQLTVESIKESPDLSFDLPVSKEYEKRLVDHYEIHPYWMVNAAAYAGQDSVFYPGPLFRAPKKVIKEEDIDTNLRSLTEVLGYKIDAVDDTFGQVSDLIIDDEDWQILHVVIDTKNWVPWSRKVMLPIEMIDEISFVDRKVTVELPKESIKDSPEFDDEEPVNAEFEHVLYDYYGRKQ
ncbi:PRC-barrel domain-containing protein [Maribellus mangrovi]|uniref:PRC-barrel domain-containing protein n=1 Tax=Maribellus mangrovi TaxID=3133146 RepID=UPI0030EC8FF7